jgi:hypothetical protein
VDAYHCLAIDNTEPQADGTTGFLPKRSYENAA